MDLRDHFAGQAAAALAAANHGNEWGVNGTGHAPAVARKAYEIADAMLAERQRQAAAK